MPEAVTFMCGETGRGTLRADARHLDVDGAEGSAERVNLKIDHISRRMVAAIPPRLADLLEIAAYVYSGDQLVTRGGNKMAGMGRDWRRDLIFSIPVRDMAFWRTREVTECLVETLAFLSDDYFRFRFSAASTARPLEEHFDFSTGAEPAGFDPDHVILFSGGLDSLAGAASLLNSGDKVALVSHCASTHVQGRQKELVEELRRRAPSGSLFHVPIRVTRGLVEPRSFTQRTRSFLFACLALVVARLFGKNRFDFFENGVVSVNLPIAEHVLGSRATRTTHPKVLSDFAKLFGLVTETRFTVTNPFFWETKGEILRRLVDAGHADLIGRSFSCSHVRLSASTGQQCGVCTQCLDRRFAVLATGLEEHDPGNGYRVDLLTGARESPKDATVAESYVLAASRYATMSETAFLGRNGNLLRVLSHLPGDMNENATRIFTLHNRHGLAVRRVVNEALAKTSLESISSLPPTCLISLLRSPFGSPVGGIRDPTEAEPAVAEQASIREIPVLKRPLTICIDHRERRVRIADEVILNGDGAYQLISELVDCRLGELVAHKSNSEFGFIASRSLAKTLGVEEETVRQRVRRVRRCIRARFSEKFGIAPTDDELIESAQWSGYRLNWLVRIDPATEVIDPTLGNVTTFSLSSRLSSSQGGKRPLLDS